MSLEAYYVTVFALVSVGALAIMIVVKIQDRRAKPHPPHSPAR